ncbi:hypothetical protein PAHAL_6G085000 [Panicum hallii]|uniref:Uncharacterized protein n=1 Tax=Panicum hallii TaxID=206008 RepID=A0A2T8IFQ5_9POAL|nr:hypothetical protein PAHAL_6G085000 [Panicum hallii]
MKLASRVRHESSSCSPNWENCTVRRSSVPAGELGKISSLMMGKKDWTPKGARADSRAAQRRKHMGQRKSSSNARQWLQSSWCHGH